jgi:hypothetical protein
MCIKFVEGQHFAAALGTTPKVGDPYEPMVGASIATLLASSPTVHSLTGPGRQVDVGQTLGSPTWEGLGG